MNALQHLDLLQRYDRAFNLRTSVMAAVTPGSKVLDAGCGVGLIGFWAAQAGAARVVGVDLDGTELAVALSRENGFDDRIQIIQQDLWKLELPGEENSFDVMAAMVYLNDPRRDQPQTELVCHLRDRFLAPGGRMIPDRVCYTIKACECASQDRMTRRAEVASRVRDIEGKYGFRFGALESAMDRTAWLPFFPEKGRDGRLRLPDCRALSPTSTAFVIDYAARPTPNPTHVEIETGAAGTLNALIWTQELWFEHRLLFANESITWIGNPTMVNPGTRCRIALDDEWFATNVATVA